jgi:hypothetical protein
LNSAIVTSVAVQALETSRSGKELSPCPDLSVVEGGGLECKFDVLTLNNSPWGEPIFCEPLNVYPLQLWRRLAFMSQRLRSGY